VITIPDISFQYLIERGFYRPKIPLVLSVGELKTEVVGLIDSGSDYVLFPKDIAEAVGIKLSKRIEKAEGVGGQVRCKSGVATITLKKGKYFKKLTNMRIYVLLDDCGVDEILIEDRSKSLD